MTHHIRTKSYFFLLLCPLFLLSNMSFAKEYIVKYKDQKSFDNTYSFISQSNKSTFKDNHFDGRLLLVDIEKEDEREEVERIKENLLVEYIVENIQVHAFSLGPNDPKVAEQWALKKVQAEKAWEYTVGDRSIIVAVIDTGVDWKHEDLYKQIWRNSFEKENNGIDDDNNGYVDDIHGWDFFAQDNNPHDETSSRNPGHGTHCAGIIGASGNNNTGISGIAQNISIMPIRFLGANGSGDLMNAVKSIDYAIANHANIISASWGAPVTRQQMAPVLEAIERAREKGIIFVAAAANDGKSNDFREVYPANAGFDNVISVAASGPQDEKPSWSNFGRATVDLSAPGLDILSTLPNNSYGKLSGTSMATPLVSGLVALILSQANALGKEISPVEVKSLLQSTSKNVDIETACNGRVVAGEALRAFTEDAFIVSPYAKTLAIGDSLKVGAMNGSKPFEYSLSDSELASITEEGLLTAKAEGQIKLVIKDASGLESVSDKFFVGKGKVPENQCPFENPMFCQIFCSFDPTLPWC